jgi:methylated-DNA-[protein]-cysteine S-methyltransferase
VNDIEQTRTKGSEGDPRPRSGSPEGVSAELRPGFRFQPGESIEARSRRAAAQLAEAAGREGLLDVAYGFAESPFGRLMVAVTPRGLIRLDYPDRDLDRSLEELASEVSPRILESPRATDRVRRELEEYFEGKRRRFGIPVDLSPVQGFRRKVLDQTARIPYGSVSTYREVAARAGSPRGMRAAGNALGSNPVPIVVPCHRVLRAGGALGGYTGGLDRKVTLLRLEGVLEG